MPISLTNLSIQYGEQKILNNFNLELPSQGFVCLQGPSGCGKSTLLSILAGLSKADTGTVSGIFPRQISMMFQEYRLFPWLTALQNVAVVHRNGEMQSDFTPEQWLEKVGLADDMQKYPTELSGGMCRRVALARALYYGGDILLLDEPFQGLDHGTKEKMYSLLRECNPFSLTIMITHEPSEAYALADEILSFSGPPLTLKKRQRQIKENPKGQKFMGGLTG